VATAVPFFVAFPFLLRLGLRASGASLSDLARRAWMPSYALGLALAALLALGRAVLPMDSTAAVMGLAASCLLLFWAVFYRVVLASDERALVRGLLKRGA
jgi:hypothetical protein